MKTPSVWLETSLGAFVTCRQGYTFSPADQGKVGEWKYAKVSDMSRASNEKWLQHAENSIDDITRRRLKIIPFRAGSVVFPRVGAALRTNKKRMLKLDMIVDDNLLVITVSKDEICNDEFLFYYFENYDITALSNEGLLPSINSKSVLRHNIYLPPLLEQIKIAAILSTWDDSLSTLARLIDTKRQQKWALAEQLLTGKRRLKGFDGEWAPQPIGKLFRKVTRFIDWDDSGRI